MENVLIYLGYFLLLGVLLIASIYAFGILMLFLTISPFITGLIIGYLIGGWIPAIVLAVILSIIINAMREYN